MLSGSSAWNKKWVRDKNLETSAASACLLHCPATPWSSSTWSSSTWSSPPWSSSPWSSSTWSSSPWLFYLSPAPTVPRHLLVMIRGFFDHHISRSSFVLIVSLTIAFLPLCPAAPWSSSSWSSSFWRSSWRSSLQPIPRASPDSHFDSLQDS